MSEASRKLHVQRATLYAWIRAEKIPVPKTRMISGVRLRVWTKKELQEIKEYKAGYYRKKPTLRKAKLGH